MISKQQENGYWYDFDGMAMDVLTTLDSSRNYSKNHLLAECTKQVDAARIEDDENWDEQEMIDTTYAALVRKLGYTPAYVK